MAEGIIVDSWVLSLAVEGYGVYGIALDKAACREDGGPVPHSEAREEVKRALRSAEDLASLVGEDKYAPVWIVGGGQELLSNIRLMTKIASARKQREVNRATAALKKQLARDLGDEERLERREALEKLEREGKDLQGNMDLVGEPCAEPKFGLTIEQILDYYEGAEPNDTE